MSADRARWPFRVLVYLGDLVAAVLGLVVARLLWLWWLEGSPMELQFSFFDVLWTHTWLPPGVLLIGFWWFALASEGLYDPLRMITSVRVVRGLTRAAVGVLVLAIIVQFFVSSRVYSRFLLLAYVGATLGMLVVWRLAFMRAQSVVPIRNRTRKERVVIFGTGEDAKLMMDRLSRFGGHMYELAGFLTVGDEASEPECTPVLGGIEDFRGVVNQHDVRVGIIASRAVTRDESFGITSMAGQLGLRVLQVPFTWGIVSARVQPAAVGEMELVELGALSYPTAGEQIKRAFDIAAVLAGAIFVIPIMAVFALLIWSHDRGPVFYSSARSGRGGRAFQFLKFRSMVVNADQLRASLDAQNEADGRLFKMENDPRVTKIGHFIRKWSVDELPQLINVLRGDMNLVGPRPLPMSDLVGVERDAQYAYWFQQRSRVKPGITGLWQVSGRSNLAFEDMVELDVYYVQHWSLLLDIQILLKTIPAVVARRGAH